MHSATHEILRTVANLSTQAAVVLGNARRVSDADRVGITAKIRSIQSKLRKLKKDNREVKGTLQPNAVQRSANPNENA